MKLLKNKWVVLVIAIVFLALGIIMLPQVTSFGQNILYIVSALGLLVYIFAFLFKNITQEEKGVAFWFEITEIVVVLLLAIGLVLTQFDVFNIKDIMLVFALVVWIRGIAGAIRSRTRVLELIFFLALTTIGTYFFAKPIVHQNTILMVIAIIFFVVFVVSAVFFISMHKKDVKAKEALIKEPITKKEEVIVVKEEQTKEDVKDTSKKEEKLEEK